MSLDQTWNDLVVPSSGLRASASRNQRGPHRRRWRAERGKKRRRELEEGFNNFEDARQERSSHDPRTRGRLPLRRLQIAQPPVRGLRALRRPGTFQRLLRCERMLVDVNEQMVKEFQDKRLEEGAAPEDHQRGSWFFCCARPGGDVGDILRLRLRKKKFLKLKVPGTMSGRHTTRKQRLRLIATAKTARSPVICIPL